ncbi:MAG: YbaB/EbfC family nucleoid-associated protein [Cyclobacteriaceae bacterium]
MFDMMKMMGKMKEVQAKMREVQENLVHVTATGEAGAGMVKATANGHKQIIELIIDQDMVKPEDREMIQDLTIAAVNSALAAVDVKVKEEMKEHTEGILPNIPGLDLSGMM